MNNFIKYTVPENPRSSPVGFFSFSFSLFLLTTCSCMRQALGLALSQVPPRLVFPTSLRYPCSCSTESRHLLSFSSKSHSCQKGTKDVPSRQGFRPSSLRFLLQHKGFLSCFIPYLLTDLSTTCTFIFSSNGPHR